MSEIHGYIGDHKIREDKDPALFAAYGAGAALAMEWTADADGVACDGVTIEQADGTLHDLDEKEIDALPADLRRDIEDIITDEAAYYRWNNGLAQVRYSR